MSDIVGLLIIIIGIFFVGLSIYIKIYSIKMQKYGVKVKANVEKCTKVRKQAYNKIAVLYETTFSFTYNGKKVKKVMETSKKFTEGSIKRAVYLKEKDALSVSGEGFFLAKGGEVFIFVFGFIWIFTGLYTIYEFSDLVFGLVIVLFFLISLIAIFINSYISGTKKNKGESIKDIISTNEENPVSGVDPNLVKYIPKPKTKHTSSLFPLFCAFFIGMGLLFVGIGIGEYSSSKEKKATYLTTTATIKDVYTFKHYVDGDKVESVGVKYSYIVNDNEYEYDDKSGGISLTKNYHVGDKMKIYYNRYDPTDAILESSLKRYFAPLFGGILFVYIGIYLFVSSRKNNYLYKAYIKMDGDSK